jgi:hypothetical protein
VQARVPVPGPGVGLGLGLEPTRRPGATQLSERVAPGLLLL